MSGSVQVPFLLTILRGSVFQNAQTTHLPWLLAQTGPVSKTARLVAMLKIKPGPVFLSVNQVNFSGATILHGNV